MTQKAIVTEILEDNKAKVLVQRESACGGNCASCGGCGDKPCIVINAYNDVDAKSGDTVVIESKSSKIISIAIFVYFIPIVIMIGAYALFASLGYVDERVPIIAAGVGFFVGVALIVILNRVKKIKGAEFHIIAKSGGND